MKKNLAARNTPGSPSDALRRQVTNACLEAKGRDLVVLDMRGISELAEYFVIVSGQSDRQVQGIANKILQLSAEIGAQPAHVEGYDTGHWVLLDLGEVVVHLFYEPVREHFDLENLWADAVCIEDRREHRGGLSAA